MANRKLISPVYPNLTNSDDATRLNPQVSAFDCQTIISVAGDNHILSHICQIAIKTTAAYVRLNKLDFTTSDKLAEYLRQRSVVTLAPAESVASDESGRDKGGSKQVENTANRKPVVGKGVAGRRKG